MKTTCRLCLCSEGPIEELFDPPKLELQKRIYECTGIEVRHVPGLPSCICEICKSEIIIWYKFRSQCLKSNETLQEQFPELFRDVKEDPLNDDLEPSVEYIEWISVDNVSSHSGEEEKEEYLDDESKGKPCEELVGSPKVDEGVSEIYILGDNEEITANDSSDQEIDEKLIEIKTYSKKQSVQSIKRKPSPSRKEYKERKATPNGQAVKIIIGDRVKYHKICPVCNKMQQNLKQHMMIHTGEKPFECSYCGKRFRQQSNFKNHLNTHTGEKPYGCTLCDKKFGDPASAKSHMVLHTGERKYSCEICGRSFGYSHSLALHKRIHTNERNYKCETCDKRFISKHALKKHIRTHTGEKPYECPTCSKCFTTSGNLSMHKRVHKNDRPYKCTICDEAFKYNCVLSAHMKKHFDPDSIRNLELKAKHKNKTKHKN